MSSVLDAADAVDAGNSSYEKENGEDGMNVVAVKLLDHSKEQFKVYHFDEYWNRIKSRQNQPERIPQENKYGHKFGQWDTSRFHGNSDFLSDCHVNSLRDVPLKQHSWQNFRPDPRAFLTTKEILLS